MTEQKMPNGLAGAATGITLMLVDHTNVESIGFNLLSNPQVLRGWQVRSIKDICLACNERRYAQSAQTILL